MVKDVAGIKIYSIKDLSESFGLTERTIRGWYQKGKIRGVKIGKEWYISDTNLQRFLNSEDGGEDSMAGGSKTRKIKKVERRK